MAGSRNGREIHPLKTANASLKPTAGPFSANTVRLPSLSPEMKERLEHEYELALPTLLDRFGDMVSQFAAPSCIIGAPTSKPYVLPYLSVATRRYPEAADLSLCFRKTAGAFAGRSGSYEEYCVEVTFECEQPPARYASILIVDDIFASGKTAAAILDHLAARGVEFDEIVVAVALNMNRRSPLAESRDGRPTLRWSRCQPRRGCSECGTVSRPVGAAER